MTTISEPKSVREENAIVLDHLENGYPFEPASVKTPIVQALGLIHLTLLELIPKKGVALQPMEKVYIGEGKRDQIHHIKGRIAAEKLTPTASDTLKEAVEEIVSAQESRFVDFFNKAQPLSMRMHQLELLPGLGKKHMWEILNARKEKPFENFEDIKERVKLLPNPKQLIIKRIIAEIEGKEKYRVFSS